MRPLILDFDSSVLPLSADEIRLPLGGWQEKIRFGCIWSAYRELTVHLDHSMPREYGCVFTGSGDYHHLSLYLLQRLIQREKTVPASLDLVICDNHPDNMRYPFGLHCGSWVRHAAKIACIRRIHVIGITSPDIGLAHAWENYLTPFLRKKLVYWSIGRGAAWLRLIGRSGHNRNFASPDALVAAFIPVLREAESLYLSIDKDVLSPLVARTNWDQGVFFPEHLAAVIQGCSDKLIGCDVTGDVSAYAYAGRFKRLLSRLDGQESPDMGSLAVWLSVQREINLCLLEKFSRTFLIKPL